MSSFVITPLSLKGANIFLSNYLEEGSPHMDGLHFCLTDGSPIKKKSIRIKKFGKKMMMMIWLHQEETKKKRIDV